MKPRVRSITIFAVFLVIGVALALLFLRNDPQGEDSANCTQFDKFSVQSVSGMSVSAHTTVCTALSTTIVTYVYLHPSVQRATAKDLVFRYSQSATADVPKISWIDDQHVLIEANHVATVSKLEKKRGHVSIEYKIAS